MSTDYFDLSAQNFSQTWTDTGLITANDGWAGVPSIVGYRGDALTGGTGVDPQTVTGTSTVVNVIANQANPNTLTTGGVAEFHIADPVVALQGSGTARAPYLQLNLNAAGRQNLHLSFDARDIDGGGDNSVQPIAVQYRIGDAGTWTNLPAAFISDASSGPNLATLVTSRSIDLPAALAGQSQVQLRFITTDAVGSDEWIGIDNISVTSDPVPVAGSTVSIDDVTHLEGASGATDYLFTVTRSGGTEAFSVDFTTANGTATLVDGDYQATNGTLNFAVGELSKTITVSVNGDAAVEPDETFFVNLTNATNGVTISDAQGQGTIQTDDAAPSVSIDDVTVTEGNAGQTMATFTVTRAGGGPGAFTVDYATANGAATAGSDYTAVANTLSFMAGEISKTITVLVNGDTTNELDEGFFVNLSNATGGATITDGQGLGTITNDDAVPPPPTLYFSLASGDYFQDWHDTAALTTDDTWPVGTHIIGYRGDDLTTGTGTNPTTLTADTPTPIDLIANQTNPNTLTSGGVAEFEIADAVVALQGSGTADTPYLVLHLDATGRNNIHLDLDLRDIDGSTDNAVQQVNVQYRVGETGVWKNVTGGYVADATTGPSLTTQLTHLSLDLPADVNGQGQVQVRVMTTNAVGNDEWVGVDNISVTSSPALEAGVSITGGSVAEGNVGDANTIAFTVTRTDNTGDFTIHYASQNGTATAGSDYGGVVGDLHFTAGGALSQTITVTVLGDTTVENNETFSVALSNIVSGSGAAVILGSGSATGTITNDDVSLVAIHDIQGASHTSPLNGLHVFTLGVVTAIDTTGSRGFWIQDTNPDANDATSEAVFVFTGVAATVSVGDLVRVEGNVTEFAGSDPNNLTTTEIDSPTVTVISTGNDLPTATIVGTGGRLVPTEVIDNDHFTVFDPGQDAIDFYESLEGMRVTVPNAQAVGPTISTNTTWVVGDLGDNATGMNSLGGITISAGDFNPERIQIFYDSGVSPVSVRPNAATGDHLGDVTGIIHYFGGDYELLPTAIGSTGSGPVALPREVTGLHGDADHLTVGAQNVENLDPTDPQSKFDALAGNIVSNLGAPDIVGLEEVQDADGPGSGTNFSGKDTADKLIAAIELAGGPHYKYVEIAPTANNQNGGEPNGNIRQGYLYNPDRVGFVSVSQITDTTPANGDTYANSRRPLVGEFTFKGETVTLIDVHNTSRLGSEALFGVDQPAINAGDDRRVEQTSFVKTYIETLVAADPHARVMVMGDFNAFQFETSLTQLESGGLVTNLTRLLPTNEQFSYNFDGNSQQIDHMLASAELYNGAQFDLVHINSQQVDAQRTSDHDGSVARFFFNDGPTAVADTGVVNEDASVTLNVLGNDTDPNAGDTKALVSVSATAKGASVSIVNNQVVYVADADSFDPLKLGQSTTDSFTYTMRDAGGLTSTATVSLTVNGVADAPTQTGGAGNETLTGTAGDEKLDGLAGNDVLSGGEGADTLMGGLGNDSANGGAGFDSVSASDGADTIDGGAGDDVLAGGRGADLFVFGGHFGHDVIIDFKTGEDDIRFEAAGFVSFADMISHSAQVAGNVVITNALGDTLTLNNTQIGTLQSADFLFV